MTARPALRKFVPRPFVALLFLFLTLLSVHHLAAFAQTGSKPGMYRDPGGRYTLTVPDGWSGQITQQIQAQFTGFQSLNEGDLQINGHPSHGTNATGINPKGERVSVLIVSIGAGSGHFLTVISSSPNDQAKTVNATIMKMAQSIRFGGNRDAPSSFYP